MAERNENTGTTQGGAQGKPGAHANSGTQRKTDEREQGATRTSHPGGQPGTRIGDRGMKQGGSKTERPIDEQGREPRASSDSTMPGKQGNVDSQNTLEEEEETPDVERTTAEDRDASEQGNQRGGQNPGGSR